MEIHSTLWVSNQYIYMTANQHELIGLVGIHDQTSPGRVSITCDAWSSRELYSFFAVSAHITVEDKQTEAEIGKTNVYGCNFLLAFRVLEGEHSGVNIARLFYKIIGEAGIKHKASLLIPSRRQFLTSLCS